MQKENRIRKNREFQNIYKKSKRYYNRDFKILTKNNNLDYPRFGFTITRKFGKANKRNKTRRRLKEIIRNNLDKFESGKDYIILPKYHVIDMEFKDIEKSLLHLADKITRVKKWIE